jgi:hypothetical protein
VSAGVLAGMRCWWEDDHMLGVRTWYDGVAIQMQCAVRRQKAACAQGGSVCLACACIRSSADGDSVHAKTARVHAFQNDICPDAYSGARCFT